ncbi:MAG: hypothetical protein K6G79_03775 [Bacteroidales bacterium]|nr:hypothetical protein [Bacteroidales bacterium]
MKSFLHRTVALAAAVICLAALPACNGTEKRVTAVADAFLTDYYTADYAAAATHCTPEFAKVVEKGEEAILRLPEAAVEKMKEAVSMTSFQIVGVAFDKETGSATVRYDLTVPGLSAPVSKTLRLKTERRAAFVDGIE